jgi:hypothetical protein
MKIYIWIGIIILILSIISLIVLLTTYTNPLVNLTITFTNQFTDSIKSILVVDSDLNRYQAPTPIQPQGLVTIHIPSTNYNSDITSILVICSTSTNPYDINASAYSMLIVNEKNRLIYYPLFSSPDPRPILNSNEISVKSPHSQIFYK